MRGRSLCHSAVVVVSVLQQIETARISSASSAIDVSCIAGEGLFGLQLWNEFRRRAKESYEGNVLPQTYVHHAFVEWKERCGKIKESIADVDCSTERGVFRQKHDDVLGQQMRVTQIEAQAAFDLWRARCDQISFHATSVKCSLPSIDKWNAFQKAYAESRTNSTTVVERAYAYNIWKEHCPEITSAVVSIPCSVSGPNLYNAFTSAMAGKLRMTTPQALKGAYWTWKDHCQSSQQTPGAPASNFFEATFILGVNSECMMKQRNTTWHWEGKRWVPSLDLLGVLDTAIVGVRHCTRFLAALGTDGFGRFMDPASGECLGWVAKSGLPPFVRVGNEQGLSVTLCGLKVLGEYSLHQSIVEVQQEDGSMSYCIRSNTGEVTPACFRAIRV
eukprot:TRINITY_DN37979_c0_g1_i1.p1 TRINITY_DN37979_c0_g1~~TRINITY_DN37979_c0_g1_i1.p1  ORF type:complete len:388 (+),score=28.17 TRINITY_DN37979_c0_g1_i1:302-1465(+)